MSEIAYLNQEVSNLKIELKSLKKLLADFLTKQHKKEQQSDLQLIKVAQAAELLSVHPNTIYKLIETGYLQKVQAQKTQTKALVRITLESVNKYISNNASQLN